MLLIESLGMMAKWFVFFAKIIRYRFSQNIAVFLNFQWNGFTSHLFFGDVMCFTLSELFEVYFIWVWRKLHGLVMELEIFHALWFSSSKYNDSDK